MAKDKAARGAAAVYEKAAAGMDRRAKFERESSCGDAARSAERTAAHYRLLARQERS